MWRCGDEEGSWREMRECEKEGERLACLRGEWWVWEGVCVARRVYERGGIVDASGGKGKENGVVWRAQMELVEKVGILASVWAVLVYLV